MGKQRLWALAVGLATENTAARRHADDKRAGEIGVRTVAQTGGLAHDLVKGGIDIISELNLDHRFQTVGGHTDSGADDAAFIDGRVEAAALAVFFL